MVAIEAGEDTAAARKARGAFFTPPELAEYIVCWAVRTPTDRVLEPSCGEAAFMLPAAERLHALGATEDLPRLLHGAELHAPSAEHARELLRDANVQAEI